MPAILVKRPAQPSKAASHTKTAPAPKTPGKQPPRASKPRAKRPPARVYLYHRVKIEDEKPRMTLMQFHRWWMIDGGDYKQTDFQKTLEQAAYERYKQTGTRFLKSTEPHYGTGTDFPPGYVAPVAKQAEKSVGARPSRRRIKIKKRQK